jgi:hypothetical protein
LKLNVNDYILGLQKDEAIGADGINVKFRRFEDGEGDGFPQKPSCEVLGEVSGDEFANVVKHT